jgi:hypothetical protein
MDGWVDLLIDTRNPNNGKIVCGRDIKICLRRLATLR